MSINFASHVSNTRVNGVIATPQTQAIPGREKDMAKNNAGGVVFTISPFDHLQRFLILGTSGGTYYADEKKHTLQAFDGLKKCIEQDPLRTITMIISISESSRASSNDPALFALACVMAYGNDMAKKAARDALPKVARIGTHLFHFAQFIDGLKGWGSGTRKAFKNWYLSKSPEELAFQFVKYGQRDGWSHRDILRKAHPYSDLERQNAVFDVICRPDTIKTKYAGHSQDFLPKILYGYEQVKKPNLTARDVVSLIEEYRLPREAIPTEFLNDKEVWSALLPNMKPEALVRNLAKLTSIGLIAPLSEWSKFVCNKLTDAEVMSRAKIHPLNLLKALRTYGSGKGIKGSLTWVADRKVTEALETAFFDSFGFVEPSGANILMGMDVSGSMTSSMMADCPNLSCREAAATMALVTVKAEENVHVMAFSGGFIPLDINKHDNLTTVQQKMLGLPFDRTDCAIPMEYALKNKIPVDCFQIHTDNETYTGRVQPSQALKMYRNGMGLPKTKLAVATYTATQFSIADPLDPYMMDFVGFDSNGPQAMAELARL